jgi:lambda family phage portal protein
MTAWFNEERVAVKSSVILADWNAKHSPTALRALARAQETKPAASQRAYGGAQISRLTSDWKALNTSADSEILTSIRLLRARSRELVRDNEYAGNAIRIIKNNIVGTGIGLQAQVSNARGKLIDPVNDRIEEAWERWSAADTCHTAGKLALPDMLRLIAGQVAEAGEVLIRKIKQPFGNGAIPLALEIIEADRLMDQWQTARAPNGNTIRMGVEADQWGRPVAYWLHPTHPGDYQFASFQPSRFIRVPAEEIIHLYIVDRWPQTRGVPWLHATLKRMNNMGGYEEAEIVAARASASIMGFIETPELQSGDGEQGGARMMDFEPGTVRQLLPGESFNGFAPTRPNTAMESFMRYMLRSVAAGVGMSYESLSRDYSQSNYSSSRLALIDDRDLWRVLQGWLIRSLLLPLYTEWLEAAVLCGEVAIPDYYQNPRKYQKVRFKPRGWSWIDPTKEVTAYRLAVRAGFMTVSDVIGLTGAGADAEDVFKSRRQELDLMAGLDLVYDTDPAQTDDKGKSQAVAPAEEEEGATASPAEPEGDESSNGEDAAQPTDDAGEPGEPGDKT